MLPFLYGMNNGISLQEENDILNDKWEQYQEKKIMWEQESWCDCIRWCKRNVWWIQEEEQQIEK